MKQTVHFAHANGFPSPCYRKMFGYLLDDFDLSYIDTIGHEIHYPVTDSWQFLTKELIATIERYHKQPVIGVGHSLGGVLNFLAACERPELFSAIVLLDSPVYGPLKSWVIKLMKALGVIDAITPGKRTKTRRTHWQSQQALYHYLKEKPLFAHFDEQCLHDYILFGMQHHGDEIQLRFNREIEYAIYRTIPHHLYQMKAKLKIPCGLVYGESSTVLQAKDVQYMKNALNFRVEVSKGGHLFPFEYPAEAGASLKRIIEQLI